MSTRRGFLAVTAGLATAGCSGLLGSSNSTPTPEETDTRVFADRGRAEILEDEHMSFQFSTDTTAQLRVSYDVGVITDSEIDVLLLEEDEYEDYENGDSVSYVPGLSEFPTSSTRRERTIDSGTYALVFDNTDLLTNPTTDVTVEFTIGVSTDRGP